MTIYDQIQFIAKKAFTGDQNYSVVCKVASVNETTRTCVCNPIDSSAAIKKVRLQSVPSKAVGFVMIPSVDSFVIVDYINKTDSFISLTTEIDKILIDTDLIQFNGGTLDGMVKVNDLVTKLNNLENTLNTFMNTTFNTHTHISAAPGNPTAVPVPLNTASLTPTVKADLENTKIKQ